MFWVIFAIYVIFGGLGNIYFQLGKDSECTQAERCEFNKLGRRFIIIGCIAVSILLLAGLGWVWYHLAGGFLVVNVADGIGEYIYFGLLSAFGLLLYFCILFGIFKR